MQSFSQSTAVISVIVVVGAHVNLEQFHLLSKTLQKHFAYYELIVIGSPLQNFLDLENELTLIPNIRFLISNNMTPEYVLRQMAMEQAIGDYVVIFDINEADSSIIPELIENNIAGYDFVGTQYSPRESTFYSFSSNIFFTHILRWLTGYKLDNELSTTGSYSRALVNTINTQDNCKTSSKVLLASLTSKYAVLPNKIMQRPYSSSVTLKKIATSIEIIGSVPYRLLLSVSWLSLFMCLGNAFYILYIMAIFIFLPNVQTGWTSMSLFLSFFACAIFFSFFVFSAIFLGQLAKDRQQQFFIARERSHTDFIKNFSQLNVTKQGDE